MPRTLVTGATRGLGRAICDYLAKSGHEIIGVARSPDPSFEHRLYLADLADENSTARMLKEVLEHHQVDNLVNNAGYSSLLTIEELTVAELRLTYEVNVRAPFQCAQACISPMVARGRGRVVNISSKASTGRPKTTAYSGSKAALESMTVCWALEVAEKGVTVNAIAPGFILTEMHKRNNPPGSERQRMVLAAVPMKRVAQPSEIASFVAYLLSDDAGYVTGQTFFADGGWSKATV